MSFRAKLLLIVLLTIFASVTVVAYGVTHYTQAAFEEMDAERTEALVAQFNKEFVQRGEEIARQVENITNAEVTLRMAIDLQRSNAAQCPQTLLHHRRAAAGQEISGIARLARRNARAHLQQSRTILCAWSAYRGERRSRTAGAICSLDRTNSEAGSPARSHVRMDQGPRGCGNISRHPARRPEQ